MKKAAILLAVSTSTATLAAPIQGRSANGSIDILTLDGVQVGVINGISGGGISAEVFQDPDSDTGSSAKKHIGQPKYEDIKVSLAMGSSPAIHDWIQASWDKDHVRKNGEIVSTDVSMKTRVEREFRHAIVTETILPACDAASREPGYLTVKFAPEITRYKKASGKVESAAREKARPAEDWRQSDFRFELSGIDTSRVTKIEPIYVKQVPGLENGKSQGDGPAAPVLSKITFTAAGQTAEDLRQWVEDFVINGANDDSQEKTGSLVFLSANRTRELLRVNLAGCGIFRLNEMGGATVTVDLYCEALRLAGK